MIDRRFYAEALDELRAAAADLAETKAALENERAAHSALRKRIADHATAAGQIADQEIRQSRGLRTATWQRASAERAAAYSILGIAQ